MSAFVGSDEFLNGFVWGMLILLILVIPVEYVAEWWRNRGRDS